MAQKKAAGLAELLRNWEEVYKKGLLTFWLLLFLHERPAYAYEASAAVQQLSQGSVSADENSMYRALNRFEALGLVKSELRQSAIVPARRYYSLTGPGIKLLAQFIQRNILIYDSAAIAGRLQAVLQDAGQSAQEASDDERVPSKTLELAVVVPPLVLLLGSEFRQLALAERLNTIFGFWAAAWLGLAAGGLKLASLLGNGLSQPAIRVGGIGIVMAGAYWLLRRKHIDAPAALFP